MSGNAIWRGVRPRGIVWLMALGLLCAAPAPAPAAEVLSSRLRTFLEAEAPSVGEEPLLSEHSVTRFYENRGFRPAWMDDGAPRPAARDLLNIIEQAGRHGLTPADYHAPFLRRLLETAAARRLSPGARVEGDIALTDAALELGAHFAAGRLDPETLMPQWSLPEHEIDLPRLLQAGLDNGNPVAALESLLPQQSAYWQLVDGLSRLRSIVEDGGWPRIAEGPNLHPQDTDPRMPDLRRRLAISGDLAPDTGKADERIYDKPLVTAVRRFQERHGLVVDGIVGQKTRADLNVPAAERVRQIAVNLERWRWLPADLGDRYILVNIAGFWVNAVARDAVVMHKRVVVGQEYRQTPVFSDEITYIVVNPRWTVPHKIAVNDKLPLIQADPAYLSRLNYRIYRGWGADRTEVAPDDVNWQKVTARDFSYTLVQEPGPENALGRVKIMFPNEFSVYLHDTPNPELFSLTRRTFSSGCIRVQDAMELAAWLMGGSPSRAGLEHIAATNDNERMIRLDSPVPVHILYWTAWVDGQGRLNLVEDIYDRDGRVSAALNRPQSEDTQ